MDSTPLSEHDPLEQDPLEQALRQFTPRPSTLDRDRLMFLAGMETRGEGRGTHAIQKQVWLWPALTAGMSTVAACLAFALAWQMSRPPLERIIVREVPAPAVSPVPQPQQETVVQAENIANKPVPQQFISSPLPLSLPASSVLQMRNLALRFGVEALPANQRSQAWSASPPSAIDQWQQLRDGSFDSDESL